MSDQDNFGSGFILGAVVGGLVGGILGAVVASRLNQEAEDSDGLDRSFPGAPRHNRERTRSLHKASQPDIELARRSLEDKIAQLNDAIDAARQQLGGGDSIEQLREPSARVARSSPIEDPLGQ
jgi:hypothetical protein